MREINKLYFSNFLQGFSTIASVTFTLYFLSHGLTQYQIGLLFGIFMVSMALFQIPTGGFADSFGHKESVVIGLIIHSLSFLIFALFPHFLGFVIGMLLAALGLAFQTGAYSSLMLNILGKIDRKNEFEKVIGRCNSLFETSAISACFIGPMIYKYYPRSTQVIAFLVMFLSGIVVCSVKWDFVKNENFIHTYILKIRKGTILTIKNIRLLSLVVIGIALTVSRMVMNQNITQPYQIQIGIDVGNIGIVAALVGIITILVSSAAYKISKRVSPVSSILLMLLVPAFSCFVLGVNNNLIIGVLFTLIFYSGHAYRDPVLSKIINDEVTDTERSTMVSTTVFLSSIIVGILFPFWGKIIDISGIRVVLYSLGVFTLIIGISGSYLFYKSKSENSVFK